MKKIIVVCVLVLNLSGLQAQDCTGSINMSVFTPGFHPATLPNAITGSPYDQVVTLVIPGRVDNTLTAPPGDSIQLCATEVLQILNLPPSFTAEVWAFHAPGISYNVLAQPTDTIHVFQSTSITRVCVRIKSPSPVSPTNLSDCLVPVDSITTKFALGFWADLFGCSSLVSGGVTDTLDLDLVISDPPASWTSCDSQAVNNPGLYCSSQIVNICSGDTLFVGSSSYSSSGTYYDSFAALNGCDSIVQTNLTIDPPIMSSTNYAICPGDTIMINSNPYFSNGVYPEVFVASNGCDSTAYYNINVISCAGIEDQELNLLSIFPNPASDFLNIQFLAGSYDGKLEIINMQGKTIMVPFIQLQSGGTISLDISQLSPGIYTIRIGVYRKTLIKL